MNNRETYKKAFEKVAMPNYLEKEILEMTSKPKRTLLKPVLVMVATAAAVCMFVFGGGFPFLNNDGITPTQTTNTFTLAAYAAEQQSDGTITAGRQLDISQSDSPGEISVYGVSYNDGDGIRDISVHATFTFRCEGENIKSVTFSASEGYFTRIGDDYEWERLGSTYTVNQADELILWGFDVDVAEYEGNNNTLPMPTVVTVKASVTFEDGEVQEKSVEYDTNWGILVLK